MRSRVTIAISHLTRTLHTISTRVRSRYSSSLCPLAINDRHQLVRYVECDSIGPDGL